MVDNFTKWVECILLPFQTAEVTARTFSPDLAIPTRSLQIKAVTSKASLSVRSVPCYGLIKPGQRHTDHLATV